MTAFPLEGLVVVVTGDVPGLDRDQATAAVARLGGKPSGSVSGKTGLIVAGSGAGVSKMEKARRFGTPVLDAAVFAELVNDPASWDGRPLGVVSEPPAPVPVRAPAVRPAHLYGSATGTVDGAWAMRVWCTCGWRLTGPTKQTDLAAKQHCAEGNGLPFDGLDL